MVITFCLLRFDIFICGILDVDSYFLHLIAFDMSSRSPALCVCVCPPCHVQFSDASMIFHDCGEWKHENGN